MPPPPAAAQVWSLQQLQRHLGAGAWARLWQHMRRATALAFCAAQGRVQEVQAQMALHPRACFQFFGLDFLVDSSLRPWLLEINATPSMKVEHEEPATEALIHQQKWPVVRDTFRLLGVGPQRFRQAAGGAGGAGFDAALLQQELAARGGFEPLMGLFPREGVGSVPWGPADLALQAAFQDMGAAPAAAPAAPG
jgi:hypothetical protein